MKAAVLQRYHKGDPDLSIDEVPQPVAGPGEVLLRVRAAGVNPLDMMIVHGDVKLVVPYRTPLIMGNEVVGVVEALGAGVTRLHKGERVYGRMPLDHIGAFAEYVAVDAAALTRVPDYLSDEEAACVPLTALTAQQAYGLMDVRPGGRLFISGGTGSVGAMAIPLAKALGLTVATSGSARNRERVEALGVDEFVDYRTQDPVDVLAAVDYVLDTLGGAALPQEFELLKPGGSLVSLRGMPNGAFARRMGFSLPKRMLFTLVGHRYDAMAVRKGQRYDFMFVHADGEGLERASQVLADRAIRPAVGEVFELSQVNEALLRVAQGGTTGKTVLRVS